MQLFWKGDSHPTDDCHLLSGKDYTSELESGADFFGAGASFFLRDQRHTLQIITPKMTSPGPYPTTIQMSKSIVAWLLSTNCSTDSSRV
jgi:hypothetical protein